MLNSYSFAGSATLLRDALTRKAILHPLSGLGGYQKGLAAVDTLKQLSANDSTITRFVERYPILMSGLTPVSEKHSEDKSSRVLRSTDAARA